VNWDAIGAIGEVVGALAVVATLGYLAIQLRQNTKSVQSSAYGIWAQNLQSLVSEGISNQHVERWLREAWVEGKLTEDTWQPFILYHQQYFYHLELVWQMFRRGALEKEIFDLEMGRACQLLATPVARNWWEAGGSGQVSKSLAHELDVLSKDTSNFSWVLWDEKKGFYTRNEQQGSR